MDPPSETFDSAYTKLEATIRNFSREKLFYESQLSNQKFKIESLQSEINALNQQLQTHQCERKKIEETWTQDEIHRCSVEAAIIEAEKKINAYFNTLRHFEKHMQNINYNIDHFQNIVKTCKFRQSELISFILMNDEKQKKEFLISQDKITSLECKVGKYGADLDTANQKCDVYQSKVHEMECEINDLQSFNKLCMQQADDKINEQNNVIKKLSKDCEDKLSEKDISMQGLEQIITGLGSDLHESQIAAKKLQEESDTKIAQLESEINDLQSFNKLCMQQADDKMIEQNNVIKKLSKDYEDKLSEKDISMQGLEQIITGLGNDLQQSQIAAKKLLEESDTKIAKLENEINDLQSINKTCLQQADDKMIEHNNAIKNLSKDYEDKLTEKDISMQSLEQIITGLGNDLQESQIAAKKLQEESDTKIAKLDNEINDLQSINKTSLQQADDKMIEHNNAIKNLSKDYEDKLSEKDISMQSLEQIITGLGNDLQESQIAAKKLQEESDTKIAQLESEINDLQSFNNLCMQQADDKLIEQNNVINKLSKDCEDKLSEKDLSMQGLEQIITGLGSDLQESKLAAKQLREESDTKIAKLENEINDLQSINKTCLQLADDKMIEHNNAIKKLSKDYEDKLSEKDISMQGLEQIITGLGGDLQESKITAKKLQEESDTKTAKLENEINDLQSINKTCLQQADDKMIEHNDAIKRITKDYEDNLNKKNMVMQRLEHKITKLEDELNHTSKELANLKKLYQSRERAITKFMIDTNPTLPISFDSQGKEKLSAAAFTLSSTQETTFKKPKPAATIDDFETTEKTKGIEFRNSPKMYGTPTTPKPLPKISSYPILKTGALKYDTASTTYLNKSKKKVVSFKDPEKTVVSAKEYFGFDSSSGNSDLDSPKKPNSKVREPLKNVNEAANATKASKKANIGKRNAGTDSEARQVSPPNKKRSQEKADAYSYDVITETPKIQARKFFRSKKQQN